MTVLAPTTRDELAAILKERSAGRAPVRIRGGGVHGRRGHVTPEPTAELRTTGLDRLMTYAPEDLTVTVEAGMPVEELATHLAHSEQRWPQVDRTAGATVGGAIAAGASGRLRLRHGPVRDGVLEMVFATGDGRVAKAGGRTVKGVAGYDLPRMMTGALGTLGVIVQVTLKLWPLPAASAWYVDYGDLEERVAAVERWSRETFRPAAMLLRSDGAYLCLEGAPEDVAAPAGAYRSEEPLRLTGRGLVQAGVSPPQAVTLARGLEALGLAHETQIGVGASLVAVERAADVHAVRALATALGGHAWIADGPDDLRLDPWGPVPAGIEVMRRLKAAFDPAGILDPGIMPGGI